jgi:hypothetical protein
LPKFISKRLKGKRNVVREVLKVKNKVSDETLLATNGDGGAAEEKKDTEARRPSSSGDNASPGHKEGEAKLDPIVTDFASPIKGDDASASPPMKSHVIDILPLSPSSLKQIDGENGKKGKGKTKEAFDLSNIYDSNLDKDDPGFKNNLYNYAHQHRDKIIQDLHFKNMRELFDISDSSASSSDGDKGKTSKQSPQKGPVSMKGNGKGRAVESDLESGLSRKSNKSKRGHQGSSKTAGRTNHSYGQRNKAAGASPAYRSPAANNSQKFSQPRGYGKTTSPYPNNSNTNYSNGGHMDRGGYGSGRQANASSSKMNSNNSTNNNGSSGRNPAPAQSSPRYMTPVRTAASAAPAISGGSSTNTNNRGGHSTNNRNNQQPLYSHSSYYSPRG